MPELLLIFTALVSTGCSGSPAEPGDLSSATPGDTIPTAPPPDTGVPVAASLLRECDAPDAAWIWCDDFEQDRLDSYFEHNDAGGDFVRDASVGLGESTGMRTSYREGKASVGWLHLAFGRTPQAAFRPADSGTEDYREIYWRVFVRNDAGWSGGGGHKLTRATIFASDTSWAQAMIAHVWSGGAAESGYYLVLDPASGTDQSGNLVSTKYNDFEHLRWLGFARGTTPLFAPEMIGKWYCVEARVRLNDPGNANGEFHLWIDGVFQASREDLNWLGSFDSYGVNAVFLENYWNGGAPRDQERYLDNFVVSTERIGCG